MRFATGVISATSSGARVYAHAMPTEAGDLALADFDASEARLSAREGAFEDASDVAIHRYPSLDAAPSPEDDDALGVSNRGHLRFLERETGFVPSTHSLGRGRKPKK